MSEVNIHVHNAMHPNYSYMRSTGSAPGNYVHWEPRTICCYIGKGSTLDILYNVVFLEGILFIQVHVLCIANCGNQEAMHCINLDYTYTA